MTTVVRAAIGAALSGRSYTLDDEALNPLTFVEANAEWITLGDLCDLVDLGIGAELRYGGGAAAEFVLRRTS